MADSKPNFLELAKQGNPRAIAFLLNGQLLAKGITAVVTKDKYFDKEERLKIIFEFEQAKSKEKILIFSQKFFQQIKPESISSVMVYGREKGNTAADWRGEISLSKANKLVDAINLSSSSPPTPPGIQSQTAILEGHMNRAQEFERDLDYSRAILEMREAVKNYPNDGQCHRYLASLYLKSGQATMARIHDRRALEIQPDIEGIENPEIISGEIPLNSEAKIEDDLNQNLSLFYEFVLKLEKASDLLANNDFENAKLAAEGFLVDVAKNDKELDCSEQTKNKSILNALYIKAICHAYIESIESALNVLHYALERSSESPSELDIISKIKDLAERCERVGDKNITLKLESPSLRNDRIKASDKAIDSPKKIALRNVASFGIPKIEIPRIGVDWIPAGIALVLYLPLLLLLLVPVLFFGIILISNPIGWIIIVLLVIYFIGQQNG